MKNSSMVSVKQFSIMLMVGLCSLGVFSGAFAQERNPHTFLKLGVGKSRIIDVSTSIMRASMANPEVADTVVLSPKQLYVVAKSVGTTNLTLWDEKGRVLTVYDLEITPNVEGLMELIQQLLPEEKDIRVVPSHDSVTLWGKVSSKASLAEVVAMAEAYAPKKVINLLQVNQPPKKETPKIVVDVIKGIAVDQVKF